jgi:uncharacterized protein (DUF2236 family)
MTDRGYFPPGTVLREVHEQRAVGLLYGQRALAIGALAPLNFIGTKRHSRALDKPFQRLTHTGKAFETIFFGTRAEADRVLAFVARLHQEVEGDVPAGEESGPVPAGSHYSAFDPGLMLWTIAVMADSAVVFYELFVRRLSTAEKDELWGQYVRFGELFGMPADVAPGSWADFRAYYDGFIAGDDAYLSAEARHVGSAILFHIPVPAMQWPGMRVHNLIMRGALPPRVRDFYGVPWGQAQASAFRAAVAASRATRPLTPRRMRIGPNTYFFDNVAKTERARIRAGKTVHGALA